MVVSGIDSAAVRIMDGEPGMAFRFRLNWPATWPSQVFEEWNGGSLAGFSTGVQQGLGNAALFMIAPNPVRDKAMIVFFADQPGPAELTGTDKLGRICLRQVVQLERGSNHITARTNDLTAGLYDLSLRMHDGRVVSARMILAGR